jgi:hypothetical protein
MHLVVTSPVLPAIAGIAALLRFAQGRGGEFGFLAILCG